MQNEPYLHSIFKLSKFVTLIFLTQTQVGVDGVLTLSMPQVENVSIIAPYYVDIDTNEAGSVFYR